MLDSRLVEPIIQYCERKDSSFFAEPLGLFSNLGFFVAAAGIFLLGRVTADERVRRHLYVLAFEAGAVGVGSGLYHAVPNILSMIADVIPILLFLATFASFYFMILRSEEGSCWKRAVFTLMILICSGLLAVRTGFAEFLAGGEYYIGLAPAFLFLAVRDRQRLRARALFLGSLAFAFALVARSVDEQLCPFFPYGTHFLWHLFNSALVYILAYALFLSRLKTGTFKLRMVEAET